MLTNQLATKYARALLEIAVEEQKLQECGKALQQISEAVYSQADLADFINHPQVKPEAKKEVLAKVLPEELLQGIVKNFIMLLLDKRRESLLKAITETYTVMANEAQNIVTAEVTVAYELSEAQEKQLVEKLSLTTGKTVVVTTKVDKSIVGGVVVKMGDKLIDGSVARQMQELQMQLMK